MSLSTLNEGATKSAWQIHLQGSTSGGRCASAPLTSHATASCNRACAWSFQRDFFFCMYSRTRTYWHAHRVTERVLVRRCGWTCTRLQLEWLTVWSSSVDSSRSLNPAWGYQGRHSHGRAFTLLRSPLSCQRSGHASNQRRARDGCRLGGEITHALLTIWWSKCASKAAYYCFTKQEASYSFHGINCWYLLELASFACNTWLLLFFLCLQTKNG